MAQIEKELKNIEKSAAFKRESAITRSLNTLMKKHSCTKTDLVALLESGSKTQAKSGERGLSGAPRKPRVMKIFRNPSTGETVETRGGNHRILKAWKTEYNLVNIDEWLVGTKD
jgi:hypothetical protein